MRTGDQRNFATAQRVVRQADSTGTAASCDGKTLDTGAQFGGDFDAATGIQNVGGKGQVLGGKRGFVAGWIGADGLNGDGLFRTGTQAAGGQLHSAIFERGGFQPVQTARAFEHSDAALGFQCGQQGHAVFAGDAVGKPKRVKVAIGQNTRGLSDHHIRWFPRFRQDAGQARNQAACRLKYGPLGISQTQQGDRTVVAARL